MRRPHAVILAGPNGAGKTTFAFELLRGELGVEAFVNADLIAAALSPGDPDRAAIEAGRRMSELIGRLIAERSDFAFETTLAGRGTRRTVDSLLANGYRVDLVFLWLSSPDVALERVRGRVRMGGHNIPEEAIRRRFERGLLNFWRVYRNRVSAWRVYRATRPAVGRGLPLIAQGEKGEIREVADPEAWERIGAWLSERTGERWP